MLWLKYKKFPFQNLGNGREHKTEIDRLLLVSKLKKSSIL